MISKKKWLSLLKEWASCLEHEDHRDQFIRIGGIIYDLALSEGISISPAEPKPGHGGEN